jgi:hypothetical protein
MSKLQLKVHCVKGEPCLEDGQRLGEFASVELAGFTGKQGKWVNPILPMKKIGQLRQFVWSSPGHGLRLEQLSVALRRGQCLRQSAVWVDDPDRLAEFHDGVLSASFWLGGHVPLYLSAESLSGRLRLPTWQINPEGSEKQPWTTCLGKWQHWQAGFVHIAAFQEKVFSDAELLANRIGFGEMHFPGARDVSRLWSLWDCDQESDRPLAARPWASPEECLASYLRVKEGASVEDETATYLDIRRWPLLALPVRRIDWLLSQPWLHGNTLQALRQIIQRDDFADEWRAFAQWRDNGPGGPSWRGPEPEVFHPHCYYDGNEVVHGLVCVKPPRPTGLGLPTWLPVAGGPERYDSDPRPATLDQLAGWLFEHMDRGGHVPREDKERWERQGLDYRVVDEERTGPVWRPRSYVTREGDPHIVNAQLDAGIVLSWLTKLAEDAEAMWLHNKRARSARRRSIHEALDTWVGRVTQPLLQALLAGGEESSGEWFYEEMRAQKERCLAALDRKKAPSASVEDRIDELLTDLVYASQTGGENWMYQEGLRVGLLAQDRRGRRILKEALAIAKELALFDTDELLATATACREQYYEEQLDTFIDDAIEATDDAIQAWLSLAL